MDKRFLQTSQGTEGKGFDYAVIDVGIFGEVIDHFCPHEASVLVRTILAVVANSDVRQVANF